MVKKIAPRHMRYKDPKRRRRKKKEYHKKPGPKKKPGRQAKRRSRAKPKVRKGRLDYPEVRQGIIDAVTLGNYIDISAQAMEVSKSHLYDWLKRAKEDRRADRRTKYRKFADLLRKALAEAEIGDVTRLAAAAQDPKFWKAAAHKLAVRSSKRWGEKRKVEVTGSLEVNDLYPILERVIEVARNYIKPSDHAAYAQELERVVPEGDGEQAQSGEGDDNAESLLA